jgi:enoyl-CoA hydratase/carnithine racemase
MPAEPELLVEHAGPIVRVVLNRPRRLNALSQSLMDELRQTWADLAADPALRCVIVTGAGRGFCAGADMALLAADRSSAPADVHDELSFLPGDTLDVPVIVAVNGVCAGGGLHFVADADIVIAGHRATFSDPHVTAGQVSALEPLSLALRARPDIVRRLVLLGPAGALDADAALSAGLVSEVVPDGELGARARELASGVCAGSPAAIAASRRLLRRFERRLVDASLQEGWEAIRAHWAHPDAAEGPAAFVERRPPRWAAPETGS